MYMRRKNRFPSQRSWSSILLACVVAQAAWLAGDTKGALAGEPKRPPYALHDGTAPDGPRVKPGVIARRDFPEGRRPANLYRLQAGTSDACKEILQALNAPYHEEAYKGWPREIGGLSDSLMENPLSYVWLQFDGPIRIGVIRVNIDSTGPEEWIVKEVSSSGGRWGEALYWLPPDVDPTKLERRDFWRVVYGDGNKNQISILPPPKESLYRKIPLPLWDVVSVGGRTYVLLIVLRNDGSPQRVTIRVLAMRDRQSADEVCRISTKPLIAGLRY